MFDLLMYIPISSLPAKLLIHQDVVSIYKASDKSNAEVAKTVKAVKISILPIRSNYADIFGEGHEMVVLRLKKDILTTLWQVEKWKLPQIAAFEDDSDLRSLALARN